MTQTLVELLLKIGFRRIHAAVLAQLIKANKITARDLERECDLRQPEVSLALSYFIEKKWVTITQVETETGRGRPTLLYTLIPVEQLYQIIQKEKHNEIRVMQDLLNELRMAMIPAKGAAVPVEASVKKEGQLSIL